MRSYKRHFIVSTLQNGVAQRTSAFSEHVHTSIYIYVCLCLQSCIFVCDCKRENGLVILIWSGEMNQCSASIHKYICIHSWLNYFSACSHLLQFMKRGHDAENINFSAHFLWAGCSNQVLQGCMCQCDPSLAFNQFDNFLTNTYN